MTAEKDSVTWDVDEDYARGQKLVIKQILLGAEAKENEFNVVEVSLVHVHSKSYKLCMRAPVSASCMPA